MGLVVGTFEQRLEGDVGNEPVGAPAEFLLLSYLWFSTHKDLPSGDIGSVWKNFSWSLLGWGAGTTGMSWAGIQRTGQRLSTENDPAPNICSTEVEKPCV